MSHQLRLFPYCGGRIDFCEDDLAECRRVAALVTRYHRKVRALDPNELNRLFEQTTLSQYTRELLFSSIVDLMSLVVCGITSSVRSVYLASLGEITASLTAVDEKLQGLEPGVCRGLGRDPTRRLEPLVHQRDATLPERVPGYQAKILDGNHRAATEHRIEPPRTTHAAPWPGPALVVLDPAPCWSSTWPRARTPRPKSVP